MLRWIDGRSRRTQRDGPGNRTLETLHFLVQQHNYKEEGIIYPMADGALPERAAEMAAVMTDL